jgi:putative hydrolase
MLKIDLHLHTVASRHAYNTIYEYVKHAQKLKMKIIGISDHGPDLDCTLTDDVYFRTMYRIPRFIEGIRVLRGAEASIINTKGEIDISDKAIKKLDYIIAGLHLGSSYKDRGRSKNTSTVINAIKSGKVDIISHPDEIDILGDIDKIKIYETACKSNVLLELNLSHIMLSKVNDEIISRYKSIVDIAKKYRCKIIIGSDAHCIWEMADDSNLKKIQKQIGLDDKMIINNYPKELFKLLKIDE